MSLLDDVSIVVTPNGYKANTLFAAIPVPTFGSDEVTNGNFATDTDWSKGGGWSIGGGVATHNGSTNANIAQSIPLTVGTAYSVTYTVINASVGSQIGIAPQGTTIQIERTADGTYTETFTSGAASFYIRSLWNSDNPVSVSNVSVKEWVGADMDVTRATAATRVDEDGLIADVLSNVPRIDYTGGGCPHILAEPQRTNTLTYSEDFSQWATSGTTPTLTTGQSSPSGESNATKISGTIGSSLIYLATASSSTATRSIYARTVSGTGTARLMSYYTNSNNLFTLTEEWQRFELTGTVVNSANYYIDFRDSSQTLSEFIIWGAQSEEATYATSYIPTSGSTVTRNQDIFTRDGISSLINSTEGVLFAELAALSDDGTNRYLSISSSITPSDDYIYFRFMSTSNRVLCRTRVGGSTINTLEKTISDTTAFNKYAIKWKSGDYAFWINGVEELVDTSATVFGADVLNQIKFDFPVGSGTFPSKVKQLQVYDTALTDVQLAALTT